METKNEKFKRLATKRTNDVLEKLRVLGNLSVRNNYDYSQEEINKIFKSIDEQLKETKSRFSSGSKSKTFSL